MKKRSKLRLTLGKIYYTNKRYLEWYFGGMRYSKEKSEEKLPYLQFSHETPLMRQLKNVDMWMQFNKIRNLEIAIKQLDGVIIKPGEIFSYWKLIGKPTKKKGYLDGMVLSFGEFKAGVGGGLCQLSNLIFWMTIHTNLEVTERHRHSFDVFPDSNRTQPFGSGATCVYNYRDLQIYNNTETNFQLSLCIDNENLHGEWRSSSEPSRRYEIYEKKHWITHEYGGGYIRHNTIFRKEFSCDGNLMADCYLTENNAMMMYQPFLAESNLENVNLENIDSEKSEV